jgi:hypothetical protein
MPRVSGVGNLTGWKRCCQSLSCVFGQETLHPCAAGDWPGAHVSATVTVSRFIAQFCRASEMVGSDVTAIRDDQASREVAVNLARVSRRRHHADEKFRMLL